MDSADDYYSNDADFYNDADYYFGESSENEISMWESSYANGTSDDEEEDTSEDESEDLDSEESEESSVSTEDNARHYPMRRTRGTGTQRRHNTRQ